MTRVNHNSTFCEINRKLTHWNMIENAASLARPSLKLRHKGISNPRVQFRPSPFNALALGELCGILHGQNG